MTLVLLISMVMGAACADTFNLTTGETVVGDLLLTSANDVGVQIKLLDGEYKRISWSSFSQEDLKKLSANAKLQPFVEPFIEVTQEERLKRTDVKPVPPPRLERPARQSIFGAMFSSSLGIFIVLVLWVANIYAGYEVAIYRAKPVALVCGVSAVLPFIGPLIFLGMKTDVKWSASEAPEEAPAQATTSAAAAPAPVAGSAPGVHPRPVGDAPAAADDVNPMRAEGVAHPTALHLHHDEPAKPKPAPTTTYQRGQFTFNRRFFETRFPGFFGAVKREADKDMVLVFKTARGEYIGERITRIASGDLHLLVRKGQATEELLIPFTEVQEIRHKHKDA